MNLGQNGDYVNNCVSPCFTNQPVPGPIRGTLPHPHFLVSVLCRDSGRDTVEVRVNHRLRVTAVGAGQYSQLCSSCNIVNVTVRESSNSANIKLSLNSAHHTAIYRTIERQGGWTDERLGEMVQVCKTGIYITFITQQCLLQFLCTITDPLFITVLLLRDHYKFPYMDM